MARKAKDYSRFDKYGPQLIADLIADFRLTPNQAAGFPGNFGAESDGFTDIVEDGAIAKGTAGGTGWGQWTGLGRGRRGQFEAYLTRNHFFGLSSLSEAANSYIANYKWLWNELHGPEGARVLPKLRNVTAVEDATEIVGREYERPANLSQSLAARIRWAKRALDRYTADPPKPTQWGGPIPETPAPDTVKESVMPKQPQIPVPIALPTAAPDLSQLLNFATMFGGMIPGPIGQVIGVVGKVLANNAANPNTNLEPHEVPAILNQIVEETKASPEIQHVTNTETAWYQQRSKWSAIVALATPVAALAGFNLSPANSELISGGLATVGSAISAYLAYRAGTAKKPLFTKEPDPRDTEIANMKMQLAALTAASQAPAKPK
jgi:hypothetical protein